MKLIELILAIILSVLICKGFSLLEIVLNLFIFTKHNKRTLKDCDELLSKLSEKSLLISLIIIYLIANAVSTICMYGFLILFNFSFALQISAAWFVLRTIITFLRFKNNWKSLIKDKVKLIQNKK